MNRKWTLRAGTPDDDNRSYLPFSIIGSDIVVNENGNNSQPYPARLQKFQEVIADGKENIWYEYVPASYDPEKKAPLIVSLHGGLMTGWGQCVYSSWSMLAEREGLLCVFPDASEMMFWCTEGIYESGGPTELDGKTVARAPADYRENHDLNFVRGLIERMKQKYNVDESRIFMQGMSMGNMMTHQFARYYGDLLAGAAGAGGSTFPYCLFDQSGKIKNIAGPVPVWQSRPEHNSHGSDYREAARKNDYNRYYWLKLNECDPLPEIRIHGENNFAFYRGKKADLVYLDIKNRDHGQSLDEAYLYWDYFFSGLRREADGSITMGETNLPRKGDEHAAAFAPGVSRVWWHNRVVELKTAPVRWQKLKYHGLNGGQLVRGEYTCVPVSFLAEMAGGTLSVSEDTLTAAVTLPDGRELQFARGSIGCMIDDKLRSMYCEALHREGELLISVEWFARYILGWTATECDGVTYVTDHFAELSYYMAGVIRDILEGNHTFESYEKIMREAIPFLRTSERNTEGN